MSRYPWLCNLWVCPDGHLVHAWKKHKCPEHVGNLPCGKPTKKITSKAAQAAFTLGGFQAVIDLVRNRR